MSSIIYKKTSIIDFWNRLILTLTITTLAVWPSAVMTTGTSPALAMARGITQIHLIQNLEIAAARQRIEAVALAPPTVGTKATLQGTHVTQAGAVQGDYELIGGTVPRFIGGADAGCGATETCPRRRWSRRAEQARRIWRSGCIASLFRRFTHGNRVPARRRRSAHFPDVTKRRRYIQHVAQFPRFRSPPALRKQLSAMRSGNSIPTLVSDPIENSVLRPDVSLAQAIPRNRDQTETVES